MVFATEDEFFVVDEFEGVMEAPNPGRSWVFLSFELGENEDLIEATLSLGNSNIGGEDELVVVSLPMAMVEREPGLPAVRVGGTGGDEDHGRFQEFGALGKTLRCGAMRCDARRCGALRSSLTTFSL